LGKVVKEASSVKYTIGYPYADKNESESTIVSEKLEALSNEKESE